MIIDKFLELGVNQAVTASSATTNNIDFFDAEPNIGRHNCQPQMLFTVTEDVAAAGSATVQFKVRQSGALEFPVFVDLLVSTPFIKTKLTAGFKMLLPIPQGHFQYIDGFFSVGNGPLTAGKFTTEIVYGYDANKSYPDSPSIS